VNKIDKKKRIKKECHCEICGEELDEDEVYELDGMILCFDCYHGEDLRAIEENE
jgi:formylmethanofuran dehydrogenase subunit E